jgi:hypothetical protein
MAASPVLFSQHQIRNHAAAAAGAHDSSPGCAETCRLISG